MSPKVLFLGFTLAFAICMAEPGVASDDLTGLETPINATFENEPAGKVIQTIAKASQLRVTIDSDVLALVNANFRSLEARNALLLIADTAHLLMTMDSEGIIHVSNNTYYLLSDLPGMPGRKLLVTYEKEPVERLLRRLSEHNDINITFPSGMATGVTLTTGEYSIRAIINEVARAAKLQVKESNGGFSLHR